MMNNPDDLLGKTREMADNAEKAVTEGFEKFKESGTYAKMTELMGQVGEFVDKKIEEVKEGELPGRVENFREKAESKAETFLSQAKIFGSKFAKEMDDAIDSLKESMSDEKKTGDSSSSKK